ncbi:MAG TPA: polysaccharide deacetylase family protein [Bacteroidales bacterium]|nr:polysaccharide deacetylase family protein [Bacteroidales bacterium]
MEPRPVKIYSKECSSRLDYIAAVILGDILGLTWETVTDKRKLGKNHIINYSDEKISGAFNIIPDTLLFEKNIEYHEISVTNWRDLPVFFQTERGSDLPFDIFAASFWLVTRYEEYNDNDPDEHGRFKASSSLAFKNGFLDRPVVDLWCREFAKTLLKKFNSLVFRSNNFRSLLTIDIDQAFAYRGRNIVRSLGGFIRDFTNSERHAAERYRIMTGSGKDPFDVFDFISGKITEYNVRAGFFIPVGDYSEYDKNPSWKNEDYRSLISGVSSKYETGLHPSYHASERHQTITSELSRLNSITGNKITKSRFHYLRFNIPQSYQYLIKAGIEEDYSLGYPDEPGFRAGIARPFRFFDLTGNEPTDLKIVPFQVMDATLFHYKRTDPLSALEVILNLITQTRKAGGLFISIWHNTYLLENDECQGWRETFETILRTLAS